MIVIGSLAVLAGGVQLVIACAGDAPDITNEATFFMNSINNKPELHHSYIHRTQHSTPTNFIATPDH